MPLAQRRIISTGLPCLPINSSGGSAVLILILLFARSSLSDCLS